MPLVYLAPGPFGAGGQFFTVGGLPLNLGQIFTYAAGTTTPTASYTSSSGLVLNSNPVVLSADGRLGEIWFLAGIAYRIDVKDSLGNLLATYDNLIGIQTPTEPGVKDYLSSVAGTNTITATSATLTVYAAGNDFTFVPATTNTTAATININGLGAKNIFYNGAACTGLEMQAGVPVNIFYDGTQFNIVANGDGYARYDDTKFYVVNVSDKTKRFRFSAGNIPTATDTLLAAPAISGVIAITADTFGYPLLRDYIAGFSLTTSSTTTYDIAAGMAADSTNTVTLNGSAIAGKSQTTWAAGAAAGGKLSAAAMANNTWYYWYALWKTADGTVDYGFDVATTPTLPSGYSKFRYIGARKTQLASTSWETFIQRGNDVYWSTPPAVDQNAVGTSANRTLVTVNIPAVRVKWMGNVACLGGAAGSQSIYVTDPSVTDVAASQSATPLSTVFVTGAASTGIASSIVSWTNTSSQIGVRVTNTAQAIIIVTIGFTDPRGAAL